MPFQVSLTSLGTIWLNIAFEGIAGVGRVEPSLQVLLGIRTPTDTVDAEIHRLVIALSFLNERLARAEYVPTVVHSESRTGAAEFPLTPRALAYVADHVGEDDLSFKLEFQGLARVRRRVESGGPVRSEIPVGEWGFVVVGPTEMGFTVARSDWYSKFLSRVSDMRYVALELDVPASPASASGLTSALERLREAERAYSLGDDPAVFLRCRGAIEALPGYPKQIVDGIANSDKREATDRLLKEAGAYLHAGRHVSQDAGDAGDFPVDHRDARFALNMTRVLLAHLTGLPPAKGTG